MVSKSAVRRAVSPDALPAFDPVPRKPRHDGWTPERQRAFIAALADTGCVAIAARMVNMSKDGAYQLRRQPGAEDFRRAWDAAQTLGLQPVKDEAFHRAMHGQLVPVFVGGKLMGFRRKKNDRLLMFILRHYGQDGEGRKTTINYFSTRAAAAAGSSSPSRSDGEGNHAEHGAGATAEASTTTVRTVISGSPASGAGPLAADSEAADILNAFEGAPLDETAQAEIYRALEACAERRRALEGDPEGDPECDFVRVAPGDVRYLGELEGGFEDDRALYRPEGEHLWENLGEGGQAAGIDAVLRGIEERKALLPPAHPEPVEGPPPEPQPLLPPAGGDRGVGMTAPEDAPGEPETAGPISPRTGKPVRRRKRAPKPPFAAPGPGDEAAAVAEVEEARRLAAGAEARRRKARARRDQRSG